MFQTALAQSLMIFAFAAELYIWRQEMHPQRKGQCLYPGNNTPRVALRHKKALKKSEDTLQESHCWVYWAKIKCYWEFSGVGWSQVYLSMSSRVRSIEHDFTTTQKDLWNRRHSPSRWTALQLWQKAPGNTEIHWPVLWVQLEGTVLALVFARSPNMTVKKGFPHVKLKISCVWQLPKLFIWDQTENL